jgi:hypothetical protein
MTAGVGTYRYFPDGPAILARSGGVGSFHSGSRHIEFTRAQFNHRIVAGQAVKQFTSLSQGTEMSVHARPEVQCK